MRFTFSDVFLLWVTVPGFSPTLFSNWIPTFAPLEAQNIMKQLYTIIMFIGTIAIFAGETLMDLRMS